MQYIITNDTDNIVSHLSDEENFNEDIDKCNTLTLNSSEKIEKISNVCSEIVCEMTAPLLYCEQNISSSDLTNECTEVTLQLPTHIDDDGSGILANLKILDKIPISAEELVNVEPLSTAEVADNSNVNVTCEFGALQEAPMTCKEWFLRMHKTPQKTDRGDTAHATEHTPESANKKIRK